MPGIRIKNIVISSVILLATAYVLFFCMLWSVSGNYDRDENQFITSAFLFFNHHLLPYRDYAYFHMPNLVFMYAPLFLSDNPMLYARGMTGMFSFGICVIILIHGRYVLNEHHWWISLCVPVCAIILLVHSHMFKQGTFQIWNHSSSVFFGLLAFTLLVRWRRAEKSDLIIFLCGLSLGLAIGIRLSFAPLALVFLFALFNANPIQLEDKIKAFLLFSCGGVLANLPALYFLIFHFEHFWFGNLIYPQLNTEFYREIDFQRAMSLTGKIDYLINKVFGRHTEKLIIASFVGALAVFIVQWFRKIHRSDCDLGLILLTLIFLCIGSFAATPSQKQYYFVLIPFLLIFSLQIIDTAKGKFSGIVVTTVSLCLLASSFVTYSPFTYSSRLIEIVTGSEIVELKEITRDSIQIREYLADAQLSNPVLTLSPLYAVNQRTPIYPEFATGPFALQVSHLLPEEEALRMKLPLISKLESFVRDFKPSAILTGEEKLLDPNLIDIAQQHNYTPITLFSGNTLWVHP